MFCVCFYYLIIHFILYLFIYLVDAINQLIRFPGPALLLYSF